MRLSLGGLLVLVVLLFAASPAQAHFTESTASALRRAAVRECTNHGDGWWKCVPNDAADVYCYDCVGWGYWDPYINFYDHTTANTGWHYVRVHYRVRHRGTQDDEGWAEWLSFLHGQGVNGSAEWKIWD